MQTTTITLHTGFQIGAVDPRIFGGFLEHMGRAVYEGVYDPKSKHADADGFRHDVLQALGRLRMTAMRYPGGNFASGYHWLDGIGPKSGRPTMRELAWQSLESNQFGTDEFIQLSPLDGLDADDYSQPGHRHPRRSAQLGRVLQLPARHRNTPICARPTAARSRTPSSCGAWATRWTVPGSSATSPPTSTRSGRSRPPR